MAHALTQRGKWGEEISDFWRGYYEARGAVGYTYMSDHVSYKTPEWFERESEEYRKGFGHGINSLARF